MLIDHINLNSLRVFEAVYRFRNMTKAAEDLNLTQSGVSQHIKNLEKILETSFFDRVGTRIIPTKHAEDLFEKISLSLLNIEDGLTELKDADKFLRGKISIGMPIEFGNNLILTHFSKIKHLYPNLDFKFRYGFASEMEEMLLSGELDFAFIDNYQVGPEIKTEQIYDEKLYLCSSKDYFETSLIEEKAFFQKQSFVSYLPNYPVLKMWFKHHFRTLSGQIDIKATLMDVQGVATLIQQGFGLGILPLHVINKIEEADGNIKKLLKEHPPLDNPIKVAYLKKRTLMPSVKSIMTMLQEELNQK